MMLMIIGFTGFGYTTTTDLPTDSTVIVDDHIYDISDVVKVDLFQLENDRMYIGDTYMMSIENVRLNLEVTSIDHKSKSIRHYKSRLIYRNPRDGLPCSMS